MIKKLRLPKSVSAVTFLWANGTFKRVNGIEFKKK